jgi:hypothetical protein
MEQALANGIRFFVLKSVINCFKQTKKKNQKHNARAMFALCRNLASVTITEPSSKDIHQAYLQLSEDEQERVGDVLSHVYSSFASSQKIKRKLNTDTDYISLIDLFNAPLDNKYLPYFLYDVFDVASCIIINTSYVAKDEQHHKNTCFYLELFQPDHPIWSFYNPTAIPKHKVRVLANYIKENASQEGVLTKQFFAFSIGDSFEDASMWILLNQSDYSIDLDFFVNNLDADIEVGDFFGEQEKTPNKIVLDINKEENALKWEYNSQIFK